MRKYRADNICITWLIITSYGENNDIFFHFSLDYLRKIILSNIPD